MVSPPSHFYEQRGNVYVPTELTRGPWSNEHQHGGPPAALLGREVAGFGDKAERFVARMTVELLRPVPLAPLTLTSAMVRPGRTVERIEASLAHEGKQVMRALGLRIREHSVDIGSRVHAPRATLPAPDDLEPFTFPFFQMPVGYHLGVELRFARGTWGDHNVVVWMRTKAALIRDEPMTPLERVLTMVDAESGICPPLPVGRFTFLNPDLTLYLERDFDGEWLGLEVRSSAQFHGVGIAESGLFDRKGELGRAAQALVVAARHE